MQIPLCEVVGCRRAAAWVRIENINARHEDFLCQCCWQSLQSHKPLEAACYAHTDREDNFESEFYSALNFDFADEAVAVIN